MPECKKIMNDMNKQKIKSSASREICYNKKAEQIALQSYKVAAVLLQKSLKGRFTAGERDHFIDNISE